MTTFEYATTRARMTFAPALRSVRVGLARAWTKFRSLALPCAGAGCFVGAAFTQSILAGLITLGLACFFVEWRAAK